MKKKYLIMSTVCLVIISFVILFKICFLFNPILFKQEKTTHLPYLDYRTPTSIDFAGFGKYEDFTLKNLEDNNKSKFIFEQLNKSEKYVWGDNPPSVELIDNVNISIKSPSNGILLSFTWFGYEKGICRIPYYHYQIENVYGPVYLKITDELNNYLNSYINEYKKTYDKIDISKVGEINLISLQSKSMKVIKREDDIKAILNVVNSLKFKKTDYTPKKAYFNLIIHGKPENIDYQEEFKIFNENTYYKGNWYITNINMGEYLLDTYNSLNYEEQIDPAYVTK